MQSTSEPLKAPITSTEQPRSTSARPRLHGSVLVVDDDADIRSMTSAVLCSAGATVHGAASPAEALAFLGTQEFDAVILDWNLGIETAGIVLERMRDAFPGLLERSAVVTGDLMSIPGLHEAERFGCPVLAKPFRPRQLLETVARILALPR